MGIHVTQLVKLMKRRDDQVLYIANEQGCHRGAPRAVSRICGPRDPRTHRSLTSRLGASCNAGVCACPSGTTACNGTCIRTASDPSNCGACGKVRASGTTCVSGQCACANGGTLCGGSCILTGSDTSNCGACGNMCAPGQTCTSGRCACGTASVSFGGAVQPIFTSNCASNGCHTGGAPKEGLSLVSGAAYWNLVNVAAKECSDGRVRVKPGDPSSSYLMQKLLGVKPCSGAQMPKAGTSLPTAREQTISNWICEGAPNN